MGTKRQLATHVKALASECRDGPFLDLFSGMCAVGAEVAPFRQIWTNDLQTFAKEVALAHFCSLEKVPDTIFIAETCHALFQSNFIAVAPAFSSELVAEQKALSSNDLDALLELFTQGVQATQRASGPKQPPLHDLFVTRFAGSYFGYKQCVEIDSIRYAADILSEGATISDELHRWMLIALCVAASKCSTTTGHFAQPLRPKLSNIGKFSAQRRRSIWLEWLSAFQAFCPAGSKSWRSKNRVYQADALELLAKPLENTRLRASVVYADPPYTKDQYSRYYHIYETIMLYDYPEVSGAGLYRGGRATSSFSLITKVEKAICTLIGQCAAYGADLILSYPINGLLEGSRDIIPCMVRNAYGRDALVNEIPHLHSTMGGSKGQVAQLVTEVIYRVCAR